MLCSELQQHRIKTYRHIRWYRLYHFPQCIAADSYYASANGKGSSEICFRNWNCIF